MKIALLGYGKEGKSAESYFKSHFDDVTFDIYENLIPAEFAALDYSSHDIILRSPSIPPFPNSKLTSLTKYFFDHCPCPIIGVTATKGKGTTCSFIESLLRAEGLDVYLVGNIGTPAIDVLDHLRPSSVVVYEMSSFQLWDLEKSPHISVIGHLEPDHLNVHHDYDDYLAAKSNLVRHQSAGDFCIFFSPNPDSARLAALSPAEHKIPYPFPVPAEILSAINLPGAHNQQNAIAAIAAAASYFNISPDEYLATHSEQILHGLAAFHGLPHRLEFLRNLRGVGYYDDNFSTNPASTRVAVEAFPGHPVIIIVGGRDKTAYADLPEIYEILSSPSVVQIILLGESGHEIARRYADSPLASRFRVAESLEDAVLRARAAAEALPPKDSPVVLMSPAAASFDMFENVYDRGAKYQAIVAAL